MKLPNIKIAPNVVLGAVGLCISIAEFIYGSKKDSYSREKLKGELKSDLKKEIIDELRNELKN